MTKNTSIQNNEAYEAYQTLKKSNDLDKLEVIQSIDSLRIYLESLSNSISKNTSKNGINYQWIFSTKFKDKDFDKYCKANIFAAKESLKRIILVIQKQEISPVFRRMLIDFICDLKMFINYFDKSQNYKWLVGNTNTHISNFYYDLAQNVFWNGKPGKHPQESLVLASSTPFIIRQSIEYKIKRILGIDYLLINDKPDIRTAEKCFKAIENNKIYYKTNGINFKTIKLIYSWSNTYIHGGYRPEPWKTETALNYLKKLFYSGETSKKNYFSIYASIEASKNDLTKIKELTENSLKKGQKGKIEIKWLMKSELATI
jgi:hypothetical protein